MLRRCDSPLFNSCILCSLQGLLLTAVSLLLPLAASWSQHQAAFRPFHGELAGYIAGGVREEPPQWLPFSVLQQSRPRVRRSVAETDFWSVRNMEEGAVYQHSMGNSGRRFGPNAEELDNFSEIRSSEFVQDKAVSAHQQRGLGSVGHHLGGTVEDLDNFSNYADPGKVQVVSSALRVLPRGRSARARRATYDPTLSWRRPRVHQFVTAGGRRPLDRAYQLQQTSPYLDIYSNSRAGFGGSSEYYRKPAHRRIIYYATLPEIVRRPEWHRPQVSDLRRPSDMYYDRFRDNYSPIRDNSYSPIRDNELTRFPASSAFYGGGYRDRNTYDPVSRFPPSNSQTSLPNIGDNEITRVQSNVLDVTMPDRYSADASPPKFTIIDVEPPYNYAPADYPHPQRYPSDPASHYPDTRTPPFRNQQNPTVVIRRPSMEPSPPPPKGSDGTTQSPSPTLNATSTVESQTLNISDRSFNLNKY